MCAGMRQREHPEQQMDARNIAKQAADTWKSMTPEERDTFEKMAKVSNQNWGGR